MTLSQIFSKLNILNAEVALCRTNYSYCSEDERWGCNILINNEGTEIKVRGQGPSGDEALRLAFTKLDALLGAGEVVKALNLPLLGNAVSVDA